MLDVTVVIPSFNQGRYLEAALQSVLCQKEVSIELYVMDGGSIDDSLDIIKKYDRHITGWQSAPDNGQAGAINHGIRQGHGKYIAWLNSDDYLCPGAFQALIETLEENPRAPFVYANVNNLSESSQRMSSVWVEPFSERRLAIRCIVSQPGTLIRRSCWEAIGGLDEDRYMAMDYDLWWRLYKTFGPPAYLNKTVAVNRDHKNTKTQRFRALHYKEAIEIVRSHHGRVPLKWWLAQPYSVWLKTLMHKDIL